MSSSSCRCCRPARRIPIRTGIYIPMCGSWSRRSGRGAHLGHRPLRHAQPSTCTYRQAVTMLPRRCRSSRRRILNGSWGGALPNACRGRRHEVERAIGGHKARNAELTGSGGNICTGREPPAPPRLAATCAGHLLEGAGEGGQVMLSTHGKQRGAVVFSRTDGCSGHSTPLSWQSPPGRGGNVIGFGEPSTASAVPAGTRKISASPDTDSCSSSARARSASIRTIPQRNAYACPGASTIDDAGTGRRRGACLPVPRSLRAQFSNR